MKNLRDLKITTIQEVPELPDGYFYRVSDETGGLFSIFEFVVEIRRHKRIGSEYIASHGFYNAYFREKLGRNHDGTDPEQVKAALVETATGAVKSWEDKKKREVEQEKISNNLAQYLGDHE